MPLSDTIRTVHVSYDGALDPLGATQVIPYVERLSRRGVVITLLSFEKPDRWADVRAREALAVRLGSAGITWHPLVYHQRPRVPATAWDVLHGAANISREAWRTRASFVHCRGDVTMAMARLARLPRRTQLIRTIWTPNTILNSHARN